MKNSRTVWLKKYLLILLAAVSTSALATTIDNYPAATTPLAGTERLPGNQGVNGCAGCTVKITTQSIANLVTLTSLGLTNVVYGPASALDNGIVRFDGTTGKIIQGGSGILVNDLSGTAASVATAAGNSLAISTTAPAAITTAQVGPAYSITAASAVAGSSVAGAAAGGSVTITAGNAARLTSGDANGGSITLTGGTGIGTGAAGPVNITNAGSVTAPALILASDTGTGWRRNSADEWTFATGGINKATFNSSGVKLGAAVLGFTNSSSTNASDTGVARNGAGIVEINNGTAGTIRDLKARAIFAGASNLLISGTAPTIASGLCTSPSVSANNGTAAFALTVGTSCAGISTGTLTMPAATTAWVCQFANVTNPASSDVAQTGGSTTSVTFTNYSRTTGVAADFTASDSIRVMCSAY